MEKIISSIPVYNLLTNLIPGTVLAALLKFCVEGCDIFSLTNNIWILAVILYFLGIINSRISSLVFEPLIKMLKIVKFVPHKDFTDAELKDTSGKLTQLSRMNNEYRSYISVLAVVNYCVAKRSLLSIIDSLSKAFAWFASFLSTVTTTLNQFK